MNHNSRPHPFNPAVHDPGDYFIPAGQQFNDAIRELTEEGEQLHPGVIDRLDDQRLVDGLMECAEHSGVPLKEYIRHSSRFAFLGRSSGLLDRSRPIVIPAAIDNVDQHGRPRREESGHRLDLDYVRGAGVDPARVLFFRVTQPSERPKPELYWTSDFVETKGGLALELGAQAATAVILVSTLEGINQNGGLMDDINDDGGIAVRQIGLGSFDQSSALVILPRPAGLSQ